MARLTRKNIKVFAGNATNNGVFGSLQAENPVTTTNVEQIQSLPAWSVGWNSATMTSEKLPPLEEFQGIQYVTTYQQAYLMQEGMPEWASTVTYYKGSLAKEVTSNGFRIYCSLTDDNTNHLLSDTSNWKKVMDSSDLYAYDSAVVHLAGNETITGDKTFTSNITLSKDSPREFIKATNMTKGTAPSSSTTSAVQFMDKDGKLLGTIQTNYETDKRINTQLRVYKAQNASDTAEGSISVGFNENGDIYTYAPAPTDTTTTSGTQIATTGWVNSVGNNLVHRTDNEAIAGTKTFTSDPYIKNATPQLYMDDTAQTKGTAPSADVWDGITFHDANGNLMGRCRQLYAADKSNKVELQVHKANSSSDTDSATIGIKYPASGSAYGFAPNSDVNGSILTTVNKSKGSNGYFKLGNGLIVQWGRVSNTGSNNITLTFPTPFTSTNYSINAMRTSVTTGYSYDGITGVSSRAATSCVLYSYYGNSSYDWVAIGY